MSEVLQVNPGVFFDDSPYPLIPKEVSKDDKPALPQRSQRSVEALLEKMLEMTLKQNEYLMIRMEAIEKVLLLKSVGEEPVSR